VLPTHSGTAYPSGTSCLILVAENDMLIGLSLQDELESVGYAVAGPFPTCTEAMHWLAANTPDVAVLDVHLRDGECTELARELTRLEVPLAVEAVWIEKPAVRDTLLDAVAELLARPETQEA